MQTPVLCYCTKSSVNPRTNISCRKKRLIQATLAVLNATKPHLNTKTVTIWTGYVHYYSLISLPTPNPLQCVKQLSAYCPVSAQTAPSNQVLMHHSFQAVGSSRPVPSTGHEPTHGNEEVDHYYAWHAQYYQQHLQQHLQQKSPLNIGKNIPTHPKQPPQLQLSTDNRQQYYHHDHHNQQQQLEQQYHHYHQEKSPEPTSHTAFDDLAQETGEYNEEEPPLFELSDQFKAILGGTKARRKKKALQRQRDFYEWSNSGPSLKEELDQQNRARVEMYGENGAKEIRSLEASLDASFDSMCDRMRAAMYPVEPIRSVP